LPSLWKIIFSVKGDLNGDNRPDYAMILGVKNEVLLKNDIDTVRNEVPRLLVILLSEKNKLKVDLQTHKIILPSAFGGNFDPIEFNDPLTIDEKSKALIVTMYGGLRELWSINYKFTKNKTEWTLASADKRTYDSTAPEKDLSNFTFDFENKKWKDNKNGKAGALTWDKKLKLKDIEPFENEIMLDIRI
jgi:hypothetical protein